MTCDLVTAVFIDTAVVFCAVLCWACSCSWTQTREDSEECGRLANFTEEAFDFQRKVKRKQQLSGG